MNKPKKLIGEDFHSLPEHVQEFVGRICAVEDKWYNLDVVTEEHQIAYVDGMEIWTSKSDNPESMIANVKKWNGVLYPHTPDAYKAVSVPYPN